MFSLRIRHLFLYKFIFEQFLLSFLFKHFPIQLCSFCILLSCYWICLLLPTFINDLSLTRSSYFDHLAEPAFSHRPYGFSCRCDVPLREHDSLFVGLTHHPHSVLAHCLSPGRLDFLNVLFSVYLSSWGYGVGQSLLRD